MIMNTGCPNCGIENGSEMKYFNFVEGRFSNQLIQEAELCIDEIINEHGTINLDRSDFEMLKKKGEGSTSVVAITRGNVENVYSKAFEELKDYNLKDCKAHLIYLWMSNVEFKNSTRWVDYMRNFTNSLGSDSLIKWGVTMNDENLECSAKLLLISTGI